MIDPLSTAASAAGEAHRREWANVLTATVRVVKDFDLAEECAQEAFVRALQAWRDTGVPDNPGAWLTVTSRNLANDAIRRQRTLSKKLPLLIDPPVVEGHDIVDDRLGLIFVCAHPALGMDVRVALTLRLVCGMPTADIARLFLVSESTMAARLTRAKKKIVTARIPYRIPAPEEWPSRLEGVLTVLHLLLTGGHTASQGPSLTRPDAVNLALSVCRLLHALMPQEREVMGLLALIVLTEARRPARTDRNGSMVLLADQDRSLWDHQLIAEGRRLLARSLRGPRRPYDMPGRFTLQAAIAAVHAEGATYADTDWKDIVGLYDALMAISPSPVIALNRAIAISMVDGPAAGLAKLDTLAEDPYLHTYHYFHAARADFLRQLQRGMEAARAYRKALETCSNEAERQFLHKRMAQIDEDAG